jgi:cold shock CspA family protein
MDSRNYGVIAAFIEKGGFGFISLLDDEGNAEKLWYHISSFKVKPKVDPHVGQEVSFTILPCKFGKNRTADLIEFV